MRSAKLERGWERPVAVKPYAMAGANCTEVYPLDLWEDPQGLREFGKFSFPFEIGAISLNAAGSDASTIYSPDQPRRGGKNVLLSCDPALTFWCVDAIAAHQGDRRKS